MTEATGPRTRTGPAPRGSRGRYPSSALALVGAVIGCLGLVAFLILVVVRPDQALPARVDWHATAAEAQASVAEEIVDPLLPEGWTANYARLDSAEGARIWEIGFMTAEGQFIGLQQTIRAEPDALLTTPEAVGEATGSVRIDGIEWTVYDHRDLEPTGNFAYNLATDLGASLVVLHGTASDAEFAILAEAVLASAARG